MAFSVLFPLETSHQKDFWQKFYYFWGILETMQFTHSRNLPETFERFFQLSKNLAIIILLVRRRMNLEGFCKNLSSTLTPHVRASSSKSSLNREKYAIPLLCFEETVQIPRFSQTRDRTCACRNCITYVEADVDSELLLFKAAWDRVRVFCIWF